MTEPIKTEKEVTPEVTPTPTQREKELEEENSKLKEGLNNVVEEVKSLKQDRKELKEKLEPKNITPPVKTEVEDVQAIVNKVISEREESRVSKDKEATLEKFIRDHKEFEVSNDPAGLKLKAFKTKLSRFNTAGIQTSDEFNSVFEDAYALLGTKDTSPETSEGDSSPSDPSIEHEPNSISKEGLSAEDKALAKSNGLTEEEMKKQLEGHGDMINHLKTMAKLAG